MTENRKYKNMKDKKVQISLSQKEVDYLASVVEAQRAKLFVLEGRKSVKAPVREERRFVDQLGAKLIAA